MTLKVSIEDVADAILNRGVDRIYMEEIVRELFYMNAERSARKFFYDLEVAQQQKLGLDPAPVKLA